MRGYATISPQFWTGDTGRKIRAFAPEVRLVALYLLSAPNANMIGLYYLPLPTMAHEVGISIEGASMALRSLADVDFARYDDHSEIVWVIRMAAYQVGGQLKPGDKQCAGVQKQLDEYRKCRFFSDFHGMYKTAFHLRDEVDTENQTRALQGASMALRSQEQNQQQNSLRKAA